MIRATFRMSLPVARPPMIRATFRMLLPVVRPTTATVGSCGDLGGGAPLEHRQPWVSMARLFPVAIIEEARVRVGSIGGVIIVIWLLIGAVAAGQRGYFGSS